MEMREGLLDVGVLFCGPNLTILESSGGCHLGSMHELHVATSPLVQVMGNYDVKQHPQKVDFQLIQ